MHLSTIKVINNYSKLMSIDNKLAEISQDRFQTCHLGNQLMVLTKKAANVVEFSQKEIEKLSHRI